MRRSHYRQGKIPWYPLDRRLSGPENRPGSGGKGKVLAPTGNRTTVFQPVTHEEHIDNVNIL